MKHKIPGALLALLASFTLCVSTRADTLVWTNINGGDWNAATNWVPAQVPAAGDDVVITNSGSYTITNVVNVVLNSLVLGGTNGIQTLNASTLTLTNASLVKSNGVLNWGGGDLESSLTVNPGGTLSISNTVFLAQNNYYYNYTNIASLTNYGTVIWAGAVYSAGNSLNNSGGGIVYNAGVWQSVGDGQMSTYNTYGTNVFINVGTLEKTGGAGTSLINWNMTTTGTVNTFTGAFSFIWSGSSTLHGNATLAAGPIAGSLLVASNAILNLNGSDLEGALTVAQGGTLTFSNTVYFGLNNYYYSYTNTATLTNYGTAISAGIIYGAGNSLVNKGGGIIHNAGIWNAVADDQIASYNNYGTNLFINTGTLEKTGGVAGSTLGWNFNSSGGSVYTTTGYFNFTGLWADNDYIRGNATVSGHIGGIVASNAVVNWNGGDLEGSLTIAQGGTLTLSNTTYFAQNNYYYGYTNTAALTNYGTVIWAGIIYGAGSSSANSGGGIIHNAGIWRAVTDDQIASYNNYGTNLFINTGTLEKTGGVAGSTVGWRLNNDGGTLNTVPGYFNVTGPWIGTNLVHGQATLLGNIGGIIASNAVFVWSGGDLEGSLVVAQGGTLTLTNTTYFAQNNYYYGYTNTGTLTNYGTVFWAGLIYAAGNSANNQGGGIIYNAGRWEAIADNQMSTYNNYGTNLFVNAGTLEKTGGAGTTTIFWDFKNQGGIAGSQTNTLDLAGNYDLAGGTLNAGISSVTNYGIVHLTDNPVTLTGTMSANFNNGFVAPTGSSFPVLAYTSENGTFTNFDLPFAVAWQTNYGATTFTLTVLNVRPVLATIATQNLDEQTSLALTASATDLDAGQSLAYALVAGPSGFIVSSSGAIFWAPNEAQGPSTNLVLVRVTDNGTPALSATNSLVVTVNEINVPPQLTIPGDQVINEQTTLNVSASATDRDLPVNPLSFALIAPPAGMTINTNTGAISWTPTEAQGPGVYPVKIVVTDLNTNAVNQQSFSVTNSFMVTVNEVNVAPVLTLPPNQVINELTTLNVNATATDADLPANPLTFALVSGPLGLNVAANGNITWTPTEAQGPGVYTVFVSVSDTNSAAVNAKSLSTTNSFQITVNEVNVAPMLGALPDWNVNPGSTISFTATATDSDFPANNLSFTLVSPPAGASISSSGLFNWRPTTAQANTTNIVQVRVNDNGSPNLSDTKSFSVIVNPLAPVILKPVGYTNGQFTLRVSGTTGPDYVILTSTNLVQWNNLLTNLSPTTPFQWTDTNFIPATNRFYRAKLSP